jgi:hypothetical protein
MHLFFESGKWEVLDSPVKPQNDDGVMRLADQQKQTNCPLVWVGL